jgi:hypothetical protein
MRLLVISKFKFCLVRLKSNYIFPLYCENIYLICMILLKPRVFSSLNPVGCKGFQKPLVLL